MASLLDGIKAALRDLTPITPMADHMATRDLDDFIRRIGPALVKDQPDLVPRALQDRPLFGMKVIVDPALPDGVVELRSSTGEVLRVVNLGAADAG